MFVCERCGETFSRKYNYTRHLKKTIPCTKNKNECYKCGLIFASQQSLSRHRKNCKKNEEKEIEEKRVPQTSTTNLKQVPQDDIIENFNIKEGPREIIENKIETIYIDSTKKKYNKRKKIKKNENGKFECNLCGKEFSQKNHMYRHRKHFCENKKQEENKEASKYINIRINNRSHIYDDNDPYKRSRCPDTYEEEEIYYNIIDDPLFGNTVIDFGTGKKISELREFGNENMDWVRRNFVKIARDSRDCNTLDQFLNLGFMQIHCNNHTLENKNVRINTKKDFFDHNILQIWRDQQWKLENTEDILKQVSRKFINYMDDILPQKVDDVPQEQMRKIQNHILDYDESNIVNRNTVERMKPKMFVLLENSFETLEDKSKKNKNREIEKIKKK